MPMTVETEPLDVTVATEAATEPTEVLLTPPITFERFTDRARKVMQLANQEAQRFNHEYVGSEHILLGLSRESAGVASNVLKNLGFDYDSLRAEACKLIQSGPDMVTMGRLPLAPRAKRALEYAMEEARVLGHNYVGTEHMLLGVIRYREGFPAQLLTSLGLELDRVRYETLHLIGCPVAVDQEPADEPAAAEATTETATVDYDDAVVKAGDQIELSDGTKATALPTEPASDRLLQCNVTITRKNSDAESTLAKIAEAAEEVRYWREQQALLKDQAKEAKENLQGAVNRLMRLSSEVANDASRPLLGVAESTGKPAESAVRTYQGDPVDPLADIPAAELSTATVADALAADKESWRAYRFDDPDHFPALAAQKAIVAKLAENSPPINTIGDLLDFQKPVGDYSKGLTDIKGIGTGKAEKIENSLEQFWADHPELVQEAVDAS